MGKKIDFRLNEIKGLSCMLSYIEGDIIFNKNFICNGNIDFKNLILNGNLDLRGGIVKNPFYEIFNLQSLSIKGAIIKGDVFLNNEFCAYSEINLINAKINQNLYGTKSKFFNPLGTSLNLSYAEIKSDVYLNEEFVSYGTVNLNNAKIGNNLDLKGGLFIVPYPDYNNCKKYCKKEKSCKKKDYLDCAIDAYAVQVNGNIWCNDRWSDVNQSFTTNGSLNFQNSTVKHDFSFCNAVFHLVEDIEKKKIKIHFLL